jgi:hypothetical protein
VTRKELNFDAVFILTYGRSGSTLLQGLLNSIDGMLIRGENNNFVYGLFNSYERLSTAIAKSGSNAGPATSTNPWYGIGEIDQDAFLRDMRNMVTRILVSDCAGTEDVKCIGFKEIRYPQITDDLGKYLEFLSQLFPKSGFVVLSRDLEQVKQSAWWSLEDPAWVTEYLSSCENELRAYGADRNDFFFLDYQDVLKAGQKLRDLFTFLGAPYVEADIERILSIRHSYVPNVEA